MTESLRYKYPVSGLTTYFENLVNKEVYINNSWLLVPSEIMPLITNFIRHKQNYGTSVERNVYSSMTSTEMLHRLYKNRPLMFVGSTDSWVLKTGEEGFGHWETIGSDSEKFPLCLKDYLSYDEIEISSFMSASIFTPFVNNGHRENSGRIDGNCEPNGVYVGQVGCRFKKFSKMEYRYMLIDPRQNTVENGYGKDNNSVKAHYLSLWADFYGVDYFPLHDEIASDTTDRFYKTRSCCGDIYLDTHIYKKRVKIVAKLLLLEANNRGLVNNKKAFCYVVGLGLGVWKLPDSLEIQTKITVEAYIEALQEQSFEYVSDLYFAWFDISGSMVMPDEVNGVKIHHGNRNPAEPLGDPSKLLVANWAWDPNSYVGNEYWTGCLKTSGDPAACCSSLISYIANPDLGHIKTVHKL